MEIKLHMENVKEQVDGSVTGKVFLNLLVDGKTPLKLLLLLLFSPLKLLLLLFNHLKLLLLLLFNHRKL